MEKRKEREENRQRTKGFYLVLESFLKKEIERITSENNKKVGISNTTYSAKELSPNASLGHIKQKTIRKMQRMSKIPPFFFRISVSQRKGRGRGGGKKRRREKRGRKRRIERRNNLSKQQ